MRIEPTTLPGVLLIEPDIHADGRGFFLETYHAARYGEAGVGVTFLQDNLSHSTRGVLRGLHYQLRSPQAKLVSVLQGRILDVAVDVRVGADSFGRWEAFELSSEARRQLYVPPGYAHGFYVLSETADVCYKCSALYDPEDDYGIHYADPELAIAWPVSEPVLSAKDRALPRLSAVAAGALPRAPGGGL